jgi:hypothetical protein
MATRRTGRPILLIPVCLTLLLGPWLAVVPPAGAVPCDPALPVDDERAREILAEERPFAPTNRDLFLSFTHPDWADAAPADFLDGPALDEEETREALRTFLERRFPCAPRRVGDGLAVYGDPVARQKFPEPTLRAALAALTGTVGEPAIPYLLTVAPVVLVHFNVYVLHGEGLPGRVAGAYALQDGTAQIVIDRRYQFLPFGALSALIFHEALHTGVDDDEAGLPEESIASAFEALIYMEMLLTDPSLAVLPDDLTRAVNNSLAVARLNSGPSGTDRLTLFVPDGEESIDPLAPEPITEFYEYYAYYSAPADPDFRERETEGNQLLRTVLKSLAEPGETPPSGADFDQETLEFIDQNQAVLSPAELIAVACILELDIPCD